MHSPDSVTNSAPSSTAKKMRGAKRSSAREPQTDSSTMHPSGLLSKTSPLFAIEVMLERLSLASPVSRFPTLGNAVARTMSGTCSGMLFESLLSLEPALSTSKTSSDYSVHLAAGGGIPERIWVSRQISLFAPLQSQTYLESWPRAVLMLGGHVWAQKTLASPTVGNAGGASLGAWSTPAANPPTYDGEYMNVDGEPAAPGEKCYDPATGRKMQSDLDLQTRQWQTPKEARGDYTRDQGKPGEERLTLSGEVKAWQKPRMVPTRKGDQMRQETSQEYWERMNSRPDLIPKGDDSKAWSTPTVSDNKAVGDVERRLVNEGDNTSVRRLRTDVDNWATPRYEDSQAAGVRHSRGIVDTLNAQVRTEPNWTTPQQDDANNATRATGQMKSLTRDVMAQPPWGTPREADYKECGPKGSDAQIHRVNRSYLDAQVEEIEDTGKAMQRLNPEWEEILMMWSPGWTDPSKPVTEPWPGVPAGQGTFQYPYEPPRTIHRNDCPNRTKRVSAIGNGVVPGCAEEAYYLLMTAPIR